MFEKIRPLYDKILVRRIEEEDKTPGGIIIPDAAKQKTQMGEAIAIGTGKLTPEGKVIPMYVKVGDKVFFGKYSGTEAGDDYLIVREDEILGIVSK